MAPSWDVEIMAKADALPPTPSLRTRIQEQSSGMLTRILAIIGVVLLVERSASYYVLSGYGRSPASIFTTNSNNIQTVAHPLDAALTHHINNTGHDAEHGHKAVVVASTSREDTSWLHEHFPDWQLNIYVVDDHTAEFTLIENKGREAAVYLTYMINHYYSLPDVVVFLHADRYQWHNEDPMYDGVPPLKNLQIPHVKKQGYASLRCTWMPGCPNEIHPNATDTRPAAYGTVFRQLFPTDPVPSLVATTCCAQFAVTKESILARPIWQYERVRQWLWESDVGSGRTGRVLEYMWHYLMGMEAVLCPTAEECFCKTFGHCGLKECSNGHCPGRYHLPPWNKGMPKGWPYKGQGTDGYPHYGWWQKVYPDEHWGLDYIEDGMNVTTNHLSLAQPTMSTVEELPGHSVHGGLDIVMEADEDLKTTDSEPVPLDEVDGTVDEVAQVNAGEG